MEQGKTFFEMFPRYEPSPEKRALLEKGHHCTVRFNRGEKRVEVNLSFDEPVDHARLYNIEQDCRNFYQMVSFNIIPHYPPETFSAAVMPDVAE